MEGNVMNGIGAERDTQLRQRGSRATPRSFNLGVTAERAVFPLGICADISHADLVEGALCSLQNGSIVPLNDAQFAGIIEKVAEDRGKYVASVTTRCAILVRVEGITSGTRPGTSVYALPGPCTVFTLAPQGVLVGEVCAIETLERSTAIVGIRQQSDNRAFELGGARRVEEPTTKRRVRQ